MGDVALMTQAVDFIEAHLCAALGVGDIAEAVSYSLYHFCRTFKAMTHYTAYDYLMRRRVAEAARALLANKRNIIDIALDYQFNNPETFSRAFKRVMGIPPSRWRKQGQAGYRQLMPRLTGAHLAHLQRGAPWRPSLETLPALTLVAAMALDCEADATLSTAWAWLRDGLSAGEKADIPQDFYRWTYCAADGHPAACLVGQRVPDGSLTPDALVTKFLPACTYARFTHRGPAADVPLTLDYAYHIWLPQSDYRPAGPWYLEHYGDARGRAEAQDEAWAVYVPVAGRDENQEL